MRVAYSKPRIIQVSGATRREAYLQAVEAASDLCFDADTAAYEVESMFRADEEGMVESDRLALDLTESR